PRSYAVTPPEFRAGTPAVSVSAGFRRSTRVIRGGDWRMTPHNPASGEASTAEPVASRVVAHQAAYRWYHKVGAVLVVTFCLEIGCFLVFFPWTRFWDTNYFAGLAP